MSAPAGELVVVAAGGTGGHMFPAASLAVALLGRGYRVALLTDDRGAQSSAIAGGVSVHVIRAGRLRPGLFGKVTGAVDLVLGTLQARRLLRDLKPCVAIGFGGYASVPTLFAAGRAGVPTLLHEQNAVLGRANRLLAGRARAIALSLPATMGLRDADAGKAHLTGNPVRADIAAIGQRPYVATGDGEPFRVLVLGGSLGAAVFARVVPAAVKLLSAEIRQRLDLVQQCRAEDVEPTRVAYRDLGVPAVLAPFIDDVPDRLAAAHLVICRAGASTVAELTASGRPALLVPYPHAADDHQTANAQRLVDAGAAWLMPQDHFTPQALATRIQELMRNATLSRAAGCALAAATPDAARQLADLVTSVSDGVRQAPALHPRSVMSWGAAE